MTESETGKTPTDKAREVGEKLVDKLEPSEDEAAPSGEGPPNSSSPFSSGERPDEQPTSDTPGGGIG